MLTRGISQKLYPVKSSGEDEIEITPFPLSLTIQSLSSQYDAKIDAHEAELNKLRANQKKGTANRGKGKQGQRKKAQTASSPPDNPEIIKLSSEVRRLRELRNDQCSATRDLPAEILSIIFRFVSSSASHLWHWVALTYVCRGWRTVALGEPSLWGNLAQLRGRWLERSLSLAKATPLAISYFYPDESEDYSSDSSYNADIEEPWISDDSESLYNFRDSEVSTHTMIMEGLLNSPERLGRLRIDNCTNKAINRLDKPAPFLSSLTLEGKFNLTRNFLGDDAPRLQEVTIKGGIIPATSSWLLNLRKLSISISWGISGPAGDRIPLTTSSILDFLKPMRRLEELSLHPCSSKDANSRNYTGPVIPFPRLASIRLTLNRSTLHMSDLFNHIDTPALRTLDVQWPVNFSDSEKMTAVFQFFSS
ncbi:hypothetical protein ONZ45_g19045 [Pleurotus djamor]|nr:hypothetical protein ONZ45_g19045 [Pleurotus djamor]